MPEFRTVGKADDTISDKEPVFILRAKDPIAYDTIMYWVSRAELHHETDKDLVEEARKFAKQVSRYQTLKKVKETA